MATNGWLAASNRAAQAEINQHQQFLQQTAQVEALCRDIAKALADLALRSSDRAVLGMPASQGSNLSPNPTPPPAPVAAGAAPSPPNAKR